MRDISSAFGAAIKVLIGLLALVVLLIFGLGVLTGKALGQEMGAAHLSMGRPATGVPQHTWVVGREAGIILAQNPDPAPHERYHAYYQYWKQPNGLSCCNANEYDALTGKIHLSGDCEPTRFEIRNGHWWARVPQYMIEAGVRPWVEIPDEKIIHERNPSSEEGHLCGTVEYWQNKPPTIRILCAVPPDTGG